MDDNGIITHGDLVRRFAQFDRRALAKFITMLDDGTAAQPILDALPRRDPSALKVGITGSAGVGKSTLCAALVQHLRQAGQRVGVLACDPQSPFTGGAVLGDRVRIDHDADDDNVFVRSIAARGAAGGVSQHAGPIVELMHRFNFDTILVETVGSGQDQLAIAGLVDLVVLVLNPGGGDHIQWQKAGILEAAHLIAVNKADMPGADATVAELRSVLEGTADMGLRSPQVARVSAATGQGVEALWTAISSANPA